MLYKNIFREYWSTLLPEESRPQSYQLKIDNAHSNLRIETVVHDLHHKNCWV